MCENENKYYSCDIIETGFDAQIRSIDLCCRISSDQNINSRIKLINNYNGEKIDWNAFLKIKQYVKNEFKKGDIPFQCKNCIYLKKDEWSNENYIQAVNINNWVKCNAKCIYCFRQQYNPVKAYNIYPVFKSMIENKLLRVGGPITISGGEPTINREFDKLLNLFLKHKMVCINILTNAIKYNKTIEKGLKSGQVTIVVSTDSGTRNMYKLVKGVDKHNQVWSNLKKYSQKAIYAVFVKTKYIVIPQINDKEEDVFAWLEQNVQNNIKYVYLDIEIEWFYSNQNNKEALHKIYLLAKNVLKKATELEIYLEVKDRMVVLFDKYNDKEYKNF